MGLCWRHTKTLLWRNWLEKRREARATCCEILAPVVVIGLYALLYLAFSEDSFPTQQYLDDRGIVLPIAGLAARLIPAGEVLAIVAGGPNPAATLPVAQDFNTTLSEWYPGIDPAAAFPSYPRLSGIPPVPGIATVTRIFESEAELEDYVTADSYAKDGNPGVFCAIVFDSTGPDWSYTIRMNETMTPSTDLEGVDPINSGLELENLEKYLYAKREQRGRQRENDKDPLYYHLMPGFMSIQLMVDRYIMNQRTAAPLDDPTLFYLAQRAIVYLMSPFVVPIAISELESIEEDPAAAAIARPFLQSFLNAELQFPQAVHAMPYPTVSYTENDYYAAVGDTLGLFYLLAFVYTASRLVRAVVREKETRIREGMKMMGLSTLPLISSWLLTYYIISILQSLLVALIMKASFISESNFFLVFILLILFTVSLINTAFVTSTFFSRPKLAVIVAVVVLIATVGPYVVVAEDDIASAEKTLASLAPASAFALGLDRLTLLESNGKGATFSNATEHFQNYSLSTAFYMLSMYVVVSWIVLWYLDGVIPTEYGVPLPFYFPCQRSYWRRVFGRQKRQDPKQAGKQPSSGLVNPALNGTSLYGSTDTGSEFKAGSRDASVVGGGSGAGAGAGAGAGPGPGAGDGAGNGTASDNSHASARDRLFEAPDSVMQSAAAADKVVSIRGLRKVFPGSCSGDSAKVAVDRVDLTLCENQIFVLLGHNGAGKSTTVSMLAGLIEPTAGSVSVYGRDLHSSLEEIRRDVSIGICPQHDVLWPTLTVEEHLQLFASFKGVPTDKVDAAVRDAIAQVGLTEKAHAKSHELSGGMKRKLSVAIALIGDSKVVLLDEPTSGMDPYSRRSTWSMLKAARAGRIIILTTHFMDEADLLGDRIAIMASGKVVTAGSPLFLKHRFGVGYALTMVKNTEEGAGGGSGGSSTTPTDTPAIIRTVKSFVPAATVQSNIGTELSFVLPLAESDKLPSLFHELDSRKSELGYVNYGLSATTMESVFLKAAHVDPDDPASLAMIDAPKDSQGFKSPSAARRRPSGETESKTADTVVPMEPGRNGGATIDDVRRLGRTHKSSLFFTHFWALLVKRFHYAKRDVKGIFFLIVIPILVVMSILGLVESNGVSDANPYVFTVADFSFPNYVPFLDYLTTDPVQTPPAYSVALDAMGNIPARDADLTGMDISFDDDIANSNGFINASDTGTILGLQRLDQFIINTKGNYKQSKYGAFAFHGDFMAPQPPDVVEFTLITNTSSLHGAGIFLNMMDDALYTGGTIRTTNHPLPLTNRQTVIFSSVVSFFIALFVVIGFAFIPAYYAFFLVQERVTHVKHQQLISGVSILAYWLTSWLWDFALYLIPAAGSILLFFLYDIESFVADSETFLATFLLFLFYGAAAASSVYFFSFFLSNPSGAQSVVIFVNVITTLVVIASFTMGQISSTCKVDGVLRYIYLLSPSFALGHGLLRIAFLDLLPEIDSRCDGDDDRPGKSEAYSALDFDAVGIHILYLVITAVMYFILAVLMDYAQSHPKFRLMFVKKSTTSSTSGAMLDVEDSDVAAERQRVASGGAKDDVIVINGLRKVFGTKVAVRNLTFGIPVGQCFGFLGINGAGKTTSLEMLSGDVLPTSGSATLAGYNILTQQQSLRRLLGYCPQFSALMAPLTVREHLVLYARIKGVQKAEMEGVVQSSMERLDIKQFENVRSEALSGGNQRKLSVAIALIQSPPVIFLDEPSTGVDPVARRQLWNLINEITQREACSVILTTHSMEECEALCGRVGIMVDGGLQCLGSIQHLKSKFGKGFSVILKLKEHTSEAVAPLASQINSFRGSSANAPLRLTEMQSLCGRFGRPDLASQLSASGTGAVLYANVKRTAEGTIPAAQFHTWLWEETQVANAATFVCGSAFPGAVLSERHGLQLSFQLPETGMPLGDMFSRMEAQRETLGISEYSLSQTTLEDIFNQMAAQQTAEKAPAPGFVQHASNRFLATAHANSAGAPQQVPPQP